ncbi:MAG TPA: 2-dehydro-3-deoxygalactonokinase [Burkholderiaceae bacterium]|jgi:2-dehydro-3-deoxygalactonokinase
MVVGAAPKAVDDASLIGIDWGSTGMRGFLIDGSGKVLESRRSTEGASTLKGNAEFHAAYSRLVGDWVSEHPGLPVLACGMVGSKHGWQEAPYLSCPVDLAQLATGHATVAGSNLRIIPGLLHDPEHGTPDVMRGEETQIAGAVLSSPELARASCIVLPGTHSKWAQISDEKVCDFSTHMTGELFALLRLYSVLGRSMEERHTSVDTQAFNDGVDAARDGGQRNLAQQLFSIRSQVLTEKLAVSASADYLSGLLIGHELRSGLAWRRAANQEATPLVLVGETDLCNLYAQALERFDMQADLLLPNTAPLGMWNLARAGELIA